MKDYVTTSEKVKETNERNERNETKEMKETEETEEETKEAPYISMDTINEAVLKFNQVQDVCSTKDKIHCFIQGSAIISSVLHHTSLSKLYYLQHHQTETHEYESSAEDYMTVLCYTLLFVDARYFLSNLQFIRVMSRETIVKAYLDICVAAKFILTLT